jgi:hypothetical protein
MTTSRQAASLPTLASLELGSKKLKKDITDERSYHGNFQVGSGENIFDCSS